MLGHRNGLRKLGDFFVLEEIDPAIADADGAKAVGVCTAHEHGAKRCTHAGKRFLGISKGENGLICLGKSGRKRMEQGEIFSDSDKVFSTACAKTSQASLLAAAPPAAPPMPSQTVKRVCVPKVSIRK